MVHPAVNMIPWIPSKVCMAVIALEDSRRPKGHNLSWTNSFQFHEAFGKMAKIMPFGVGNLPFPILEILDPSLDLILSTDKPDNGVSN